MPTKTPNDKYTEGSCRFQLSSRRTLEIGDRLRFAGGGPTYRGDDGEQHRIPLRGVFVLRAVLHRGRRTWLEVRETDRHGRLGAVRTVYVAGRAYRRAGLLIRPYRVRPVTRRRQKTRRLF